MTDLAIVAAFAALVVALFFLAIMEAALLHVRRSAVVAAAAEGDRRAARLLPVVHDLPRTVSAILLAVLLTQVTATTIAGIGADRWLGGAGITIATVAVTVLLFVYGEAIPKTIAMGDPLRYASRLAGSIRRLSTLFAPAVTVLMWIADKQSPGDRRTDGDSSVGESELRHLASQAAAEGRIEPSDAELIQRSFTFGDRRVEEVMVPLVDVVSVSRRLPVEVALRIAIDTGHRRLAVSGSRPEKIVGFVRLSNLADTTATTDRPFVADRMSEPLFQHGSTLLGETLERMQDTGLHFVVVVDDRGEARGIATIENIVAELVGTID